MRAVKSHSVLLTSAVCLCLAAGVVADDDAKPRVDVILRDQILQGDGIPVVVKEEPPKFTVGLHNGQWSLLESKGADLVDILTEIARLEAIYSSPPASLLIQIPKGTTISGAFSGQQAGANTPIKLAEALVRHLTMLGKPLEWKAPPDEEPLVYRVAPKKSSSARAAEIPVFNIDGVDALAKLVPATAVPQTQIKVEGRRLLVQGTDSQIEAVRRFVTLIDTPDPQVRLQVWTLQFNGKAVKRGGDDSVQRKLESALSKIETTRGSMAVMRDHALAEVFEQLRREWMPLETGEDTSVAAAGAEDGVASATPVGMSNAMAAAMIGATPSATFGPAFSAMAGTRSGYPPLSDGHVQALTDMRYVPLDVDVADGQPTVSPATKDLQPRFKLLDVQRLLVVGHILIRRAWIATRDGHEVFGTHLAAPSFQGRFETEAQLGTLNGLVTAAKKAESLKDPRQPQPTISEQLDKVEGGFREFFAPEADEDDHAAHLCAALQDLCRKRAELEPLVCTLNWGVTGFDATFEPNIVEAQRLRAGIRGQEARLSQRPRPHSVAHANAQRERARTGWEAVGHWETLRDAEVGAIADGQARRSAAGRHVLEAQVELLGADIKTLEVLAELAKLTAERPGLAHELPQRAEELSTLADELPRSRADLWALAVELTGSARDPDIGGRLLQLADRLNGLEEAHNKADSLYALASGCRALATELQELAASLPGAKAGVPAELPGLPDLNATLNRLVGRVLEEHQGPISDPFKLPVAAGELRGELRERAADWVALAEVLEAEAAAARDIDTVETVAAQVRVVAAKLARSADPPSQQVEPLRSVADTLEILAGQQREADRLWGLAAVVVDGLGAGDAAQAARKLLHGQYVGEIDVDMRQLKAQRTRLAVLAGWPLDTPVGAVSLLLWTEPETAEKCFQAAAERVARVYAATVGIAPGGDGPAADCEAMAFPLFRNFLRAQVTRAHWGQPFREYLDAAHESQKNARGFSVREYARAQAACDDVLREGMQALCLDIEGMFMKPLLDDLAAMSGKGKDGTKVALLGRSTIVAQSGTQAKMEATASSYYDTTRTTPFTKDLLANAKTISESLTGVGTAAGAMSTADLLLIAAALDEQAPTYTKIAPGIDLTATPVVLEDLNSIRLQLEFGVAMDRTLPTTGSSAQPAPIVEKHKVTTNPSSVVFDLLAVSMFDVQTSHPTRGWHIPVLHRVPLVGQVFEGPRRTRTMDQTSLILLTHAIEPRAIDFARGRYYKGVQDPATD